MVGQYLYANREKLEPGFKPFNPDWVTGVAW
jgi:hypothetical protein